MPAYQTISAIDAQTLLGERNAQLVDIRDPQAFEEAHIEGALRIDNQNIDTFVRAVNKTLPLIVCCYHGISSHSAAQFFADQGFDEVYSLDGGFEGWRSEFPIAT